MTSRMRYLWAKFRANGVLGTLDLLYVSLFKVNVFQVFFIDLRKPVSIPPAPPGIEFKQATPEELQRVRAGVTDLAIDYYCDELFGYTLPFFALVEGQVAAIVWLVLPGQPCRFLDLQDGDVEINYLEVNAAFRGRRIGQHLMAYQIQWAAAAGYKRLFTVPNVENIASLKPMLDLGFRPIEALVHFSFRRPKAALTHAS